MAPVEHRKACRRYNEPGHAHFITFSCFRRQPFLLWDWARAFLCDGIDLARRRNQFDLWAYVFMPEHVHLLICPRDSEYSVSTILSTIKQSVSKRAALFVREQAPHLLALMTDAQPNGTSHVRFWQRGGGYDRNLWSPRHIRETIDYIHANPVRRGLCKIDTEWKWSSARVYEGSGTSPLSIEVASLPDDPRRINAP